MWKGEGTKTKIYDFSQAAKDAMIKIVNDQRRIADILDRIEKKLEEK